MGVEGLREDEALSLFRGFGVLREDEVLSSKL